MNPASIESFLMVPPGHSDTNLFIRSIPEWVTDDQLEEELSVFGPLESKKVMRNIHTGRSMEKAFARFSDADAAREAMRSILEDGLFGVRPRVEWARQQYDETITAAERQQKKKLFMRNIPGDVTEADVCALAEQYGEVESVTLRRDTQPSRSGSQNGSLAENELLIAFILYAHEGCAAEACEKIYRTYPFPSCGNTPILTKLAETKKERSGRRGAPPAQPHRHGQGNRRQGHIPPTVCSGESSGSEQMYYSPGNSHEFEECSRKGTQSPSSECSENFMLNSGDRSFSEGMMPSPAGLSGNMSASPSSVGGYISPMGNGGGGMAPPPHFQHPPYPGMGMGRLPPNSFSPGGMGSGKYEESNPGGPSCPPRHAVCPPMNPPPHHYQTRPGQGRPAKQPPPPSGSSPQSFHPSMDSPQRFQHGGQYPSPPQRFPSNSLHTPTPPPPPPQRYSSPTNGMHQDCTSPMMTMGPADASEYSPYGSSSSTPRMPHASSQWQLAGGHSRQPFLGPEKLYPQKAKEVDVMLAGDSVTSAQTFSGKSSSVGSSDSKQSDTYRHNPYSFD